MNPRKMIFIKIFLFFLVVFFACNNDSTENTRTPVPVTPVIVTPAPITPVVPVDTEPGEIIPEEKMKAVLLYDGSLKSLGSDNKLKVIQDAETVIKIGDNFIINNELKEKCDSGSALKELPVNVLQACNYGGKLWLYGTDKKLYRENDSGGFDIIGDNINGYAISLNDNGVAFGFKFYNPDGSFVSAVSGLGFLISNKIVKVVTINSDKEKYVFDGTEWIKISTGLYSDFLKYNALITDTKAIWFMGATLDLETMQAVEPVYNTGLGEFVGGNAFVGFFEKYTEQIWQPIGYVGNTGYFLRPESGKIYTYDITEDILTEWVKIVEGTETDGRIINNDLIERTGATICGEEIIYFDGSSIQRINIETGEKNEIAEATELKAICL